MKRYLPAFFLCFISIFGYSQDKLEYSFDQARAFLAKREIEPAIKALRKVYINQPNNANVNFLIGAAYTELPGTQEEAIFHLKKALKNVNENYIVGSFQEKGAPIHIYYYLAIALVEKDKCGEANMALEKFKKYKEKVSSYHIDELDRHLQKCPFEKTENFGDWAEEVESPEGYDPTFIEAEPKMELDSTELSERGLFTQKLEYTTDAPLYGVQIGSNLHPGPISNYGKIKNMDVFIDNKGIIRYVIGHFSYQKQAENLLETLREKGYKDAFVVNVNDERKYSNEVISYNNVNLRSSIKGNVEYYVQLGAFKNEVPKSLLIMYFEFDGIEELKEGENTILVVGSYDGYQEALDKKDKIASLGYSDAFVIAYHKGKRISLEEARNYRD